MANAVLRLPAVKNRVGLSRTSIYNRISEGTFPKAINIGSRAVGWLESEIDQWIEEQINNSRKGGTEC